MIINLNHQIINTLTAFHWPALLAFYLIIYPLNMLAERPTKKRIELEINITIGKKKYLLQVERGAHLTQAVE